MNPKVKVITLHFNQPKVTVNCVESLLKVNYDNFEIIIIDNSSKEENYRQLVEYTNPLEKVHIIRTVQNLGYGKGMNFGLKKTNSDDLDFWLVMNNDTIIDENAIKYLVNAAEKYKRKAIVSGLVYDFYEPNRIQYAGGIFENGDMLKNKNIFINQIDNGQISEIRELDMLDDIFWLLPKNIYDHLGGYSPTYFMYGEQNDYVMKAKQHGYKMLLEPKAKIWHIGEASSGVIGSNPVASYWRMKSSMIYYFRYLHKLRFLKLNLKILVKTLKRWFKDRLSKNSLHKAEILGIMAFYRWLFHKKDDFGKNPYLNKE